MGCWLTLRFGRKLQYADRTIFSPHPSLTLPEKVDYKANLEAGFSGPGNLF